MSNDGLKIRVTDETTVVDLLNQVENIAKPVMVQETSEKLKVIDVENIDYDSILENAMVDDEMIIKGR